ncbi:hypothetical protein HS7_19020 [Sulfolobales archaeon HS-7]|nr:hypothetical protein HS7_19020 [Sulfolobales archaeon HS-7]
MNQLEVIETLIKERQGNRPRYEKGHVILALNVIRTKQPIGRITIMKEVGLSEASVKTLIKRMKEVGLVTVDKVGGV